MLKFTMDQNLILKLLQLHNQMALMNTFRIDLTIYFTQMYKQTSVLCQEYQPSEILTLTLCVVHIRIIMLLCFVLLLYFVGPHSHSHSRSRYQWFPNYIQEALTALLLHTLSIPALLHHVFCSPIPFNTVQENFHKTWDLIEDIASSSVALHLADQSILCPGIYIYFF